MNTKTALANKLNLDAALMASDEARCNEFMVAEREGKARKSFLLRIHARINYLRAQREREEIKAA